jgi:hypothetical protein
MTGGQIAALVLLGVFHGVNPGMGWLFAVSTGMQERSRRGLFTSLPFIALGHGASVALAATVVGVTDSVVAPKVVVLVGGAVLVAFGLRRVLSSRHVRWAGMRLGRWQLAGWSFVMSTAHGAGLMLLPVILMSGPGHSGSGRGGHDMAGMPGMAGASGTADRVGQAALTGLTAAGVHALAMIATTGVVALLVYQVLGLGVLRRVWVNLDRVWAIALVGAGTATLLIA